MPTASADRAERLAAITWGGDEFMVLLCNDATRPTASLAERIAEVAPRDSPCGLSLGWATRKNNETLEQTMARADERLYEERRRRRNDAA
ncbi:diguanylate cyclase domain-containing protein [Montanilutibacter psychrotolerans]|uniref:Diguanylate cyclase n=1 Tax=Montanilutibacter psychrotolerans TaxID=1327343 RepID=A0A3M8T1U1_9GAMM|nr:diguanylate cyclase [Lysobacter psychrotolerans]